MEELIARDKIPISDKMFESSLGISKDDIIMYKDLDKYQTIEELLPNEGDWKIIFIQWARQGLGHWVCCYKYKNKYCYFNSYGFPPDVDLDVIPRAIKYILGQETKEFKRLLHGQKMSHSPYKLQGKESNSCGRYCVSRIQLLQQGYSCEEYKKYLDEICKNNNINYDIATCLLVPLPR
jgi:hypothetical protein